MVSAPHFRLLLRALSRSGPSVVMAVLVTVVVHRVVTGVVTAPLALAVKPLHLHSLGAGRDLIAVHLRQKGRQFLCVGLRQGVREDDVEDDDESALVERVAVGRESLALDHLDVAVLHDFAGLGRDDDAPIVQRLEDLLHAAESLGERDVHLGGQVLPVTLVDVVRLLLQLNDDVTGLFAGLAIAVAVKEELVFAADALVDGNLERVSKRLFNIPTL